MVLGGAEGPGGVLGNRDLRWGLSCLWGGVWGAEVGAGGSEGGVSEWASFPGAQNHWERRTEREEEMGAEIRSEHGNGEMQRDERALGERRRRRGRGRRRKALSCCTVRGSPLPIPFPSPVTVWGHGVRWQQVTICYLV